MYSESRDGIQKQPRSCFKGLYSSAAGGLSARVFGILRRTRTSSKLPVEPFLKQLLSITGVIVFALGSGCASTKQTQEPVARSVQPWSTEGHIGREIITEHFRVFSTLQDVGFETALPDFLESCYRQYNALIPLTPDPGIRLTTYLFGRRAEWLAFTRNRFPEHAEVYSQIDSGGFSERDTAVVFFASRSGTLATLAHEGWHQYRSVHVDARIPAWLDEGLACYHESVSVGPEGTSFTPEHNSFRLNSLRDAIRAGRILPLRELVNTTISSILLHRDRRTAHAYYAQTWVLVSLLRQGSSDFERASFDHMVRDMTNGNFDIRVGATVLSHGANEDITFAEAVLPTYFSSSLEDLVEPYRRHLYQLAGYDAP